MKFPCFAYTKTKFRTPITLVCEYKDQHGKVVLYGVFPGHKNSESLPPRMQVQVDDVELKDDDKT